MGTGTGIIPILLEAKTEGQHFTGLEIQEESADMARAQRGLQSSGRKGGYCDRRYQGSFRDVSAASFDVITSNPPYMTDAHGIKNPEAPKGHCPA